MADFDVEYAAQAVRPVHRGTRGRRRRLATIDLGCRRREHDKAAVARVRREEAVEPGGMTSSAQYQWGRAGHEVPVRSGLTCLIKPSAGCLAAT